MANLSKIKRDRIIAFLEHLKEQHNDDDSIRAFNEIENHLRDKKYGLVWEEHKEQVDELLEENIPVFVADKERRLCKDVALPWNFIIEGDNLQALYLLEKTHKGKVDCIYIDPPYNTGARDWKYNNDYVDNNDLYRHSKWLSMMAARLRIAKRLMNPKDSLLIVTIDDTELATLRLLIEDLFSECAVQIVDVVINPKGKARIGRLSQVDEYIVLVYMGEAKTIAESEVCEKVEIRWPYLRRSDVESARGTTKGGKQQFYPIYIDPSTLKIVKIGTYLTPEQPLSDAPKVDGAITVFPIRDDGKHMNWGLTADSLQYALDNGCVRVTKGTNPHQPYNIAYVTIPSIKKLLNGEYDVDGFREDGSKIITIPSGKESQRITSWKNTLYDANAYGTKLISRFLVDKRFSFPKSLYCVRDTLKIYLANKPNATVLDFFAGSGTTMHAVNLLNKEDGGHRRCVMVTNNEIGETKEQELEKVGVRRGDEEWEWWGIARYVTWPRTECSIKGVNIHNEPVQGEYISSQTVSVISNRRFTQIDYVDDSLTAAKKQALSILIGKQNNLRVPTFKEDCSYLVSDDEDYNTSILYDLNCTEEWLEELAGMTHITDFYIITRDRKAYNAVKKNVIELLGNIETKVPVKYQMSDGFIANVKYFRCDWTPRRPADYLLSNVLALHVKEMIELQNAIEIDNERNVLILNKSDFRRFIMDESACRKIEHLWINQNIILNAEEVRALEAKEYKYIPKEFFGQELKEAAE